MDDKKPAEDRRWPFHRNRYWTWMDEVIPPVLLAVCFAAILALVASAIVGRPVHG